MVRDSGAIISFNRWIAHLGVWRFVESQKDRGIAVIIQQHAKAKLYGRDCLRRSTDGAWPWLPCAGNVIYSRLISLANLANQYRQQRIVNRGKAADHQYQISCLRSDDAHYICRAVFTHAICM